MEWSPSALGGRTARVRNGIRNVPGGPGMSPLGIDAADESVVGPELLDGPPTGTRPLLWRGAGPFESSSAPSPGMSAGAKDQEVGPDLEQLASAPYRRCRT
ncbi:MAG: hypothetical protein MZU91_13100 [Desulfosudis oleivorans]|nr:hypothetical protein [Desulfosudis oleivorans]